MYELKTKINDADVSTFLDSVDNERRREDAYVVIDLLREVTGLEPKMWGPSIVGFGSYYYKYDSGHEGHMCRMGFSPRKSSLTIYISPGFDRYDALMQRLGKFKLGKSCLYINKLTDVDIEVLRELATEAFVFMNEHYPED
ncbi:MAG: DUF1801 domain-containing protein [Chloroflexota bacterium]